MDPDVAPELGADNGPEVGDMAPEVAPEVAPDSGPEVGSKVDPAAVKPAGGPAFGPDMAPEVGSKVDPADVKPAGGPEVGSKVDSADVKPAGGPEGDAAAFAHRLVEKDAATRRPTIVHHEIIAARPATTVDTDAVLSPPLRRVLAQKGIHALYTHQAEAIQAARSGRHVVAATPTASGKSLIFHLPVFERLLADPQRRALFIFPLKALERDQLAALRDLAERVGLDPEAVAVFDGDVSAARRKKLKQNVPRILLTTPDMLHYGICAFHPQWETLFSTLDYVVADELHTYRGVFGSHVALIFRRFKRLCAFYASHPTFVGCSATIDNPTELGRRLFGVEKITTLRKSGAPSAARHFLVIDPARSATQAALELFIAAVSAKLRTIVFTRARKTTELLYARAAQALPRKAARLGSYRSGYRPAERRQIETALAEGRLQGVISTSALELGIDIGGLDVCILVGYPGSITATLQRSGRVGRADRASVTLLVATADALDQYFVTQPQELFRRRAEAVALDPGNAHVLAAHLPCAAAELPLRPADWPFADARSTRVLHRCVADGLLLEAAAGKLWFPARPMPHRKVDLRNAGQAIRIVAESTRKENKRTRTIGTVSATRALRECHPGAVYLHRNATYLVEELDLVEQRARVRKQALRYFTQVRAEKETAILEVYETQTKETYTLRHGRLRVTETITGFVQRDLTSGRIIGRHPLEMEPIVFETEGLWLELDGRHRALLDAHKHHLMGSLHAIEHGAIALFPLHVMCDRSDVGGICHTAHPQLERPAIFIYDGYAGGAGLSRTGYTVVDGLLAAVRDRLLACRCPNGCPSCIHSPKCGAGNKPLDKAGAHLLLEALTAKRRLPAPPNTQDEPLTPVSAARITQARPETSRPEAPRSPDLIARAQRTQRDWRTLDLSRYGRLVVFDLETQLSARDVGGWQNAHLMRVALAVVYDATNDTHTTYTEATVDDLLAHLRGAEVVCGFNIVRFDYKVLSAYAGHPLHTLPTCDLLAEIHARLGLRIGLDNLATHTLGCTKSADGLQSLRWFAEGKLDLVEQYCRADVRLTTDLLRFGLTHGYVVGRRKKHGLVRLPVDWSQKLVALSHGLMVQPI